STISPFLTTTAATSVILSCSQWLPPVVSVSTTTYESSCSASLAPAASRWRARAAGYDGAATSASLHRPSAARTNCGRPANIACGSHFEAGFLQLSQCGLVSCVGSDDTGAQCCKVTTRRPLLAVLDDSSRAAAQQRLHRESALFERSEQIRLLPHVALALAPLKYRQTIRSNEVGWINNTEIAIDMGEDHVEVDRR